MEEDKIIEEFIEFVKQEIEAIKEENDLVTLDTEEEVKTK
jgi:hypothetical protein